MNAINLKFLYIYCNDLAAMRHFYTDLLTLEEIYYAPAPNGGLGYRCNNLQFTIFDSPRPLEVPSEWHRQPGWQGGERVEPSWSIECDSESLFRDALDRLQSEPVPSFHQSPQWVGYWSFPVKDPMGNTVEMTWAPDSEPTHKSWH